MSSYQKHLPYHKSNPMPIKAKEKLPEDLSRCFRVCFRADLQRSLHTHLIQDSSFFPGFSFPSFHWISSSSLFSHLVCLPGSQGKWMGTGTADERAEAEEGLRKAVRSRSQQRRRGSAHTGSDKRHGSDFHTKKYISQ